MAGPYECRNEPSGSIEYWKSLELLIDGELLKRDKAPCGCFLFSTFPSYFRVSSFLPVFIFFFQEQTWQACIILGGVEPLVPSEIVALVLGPSQVCLHDHQVLRDEMALVHNKHRLTLDVSIPMSTRQCHNQ